MKAIFGGSVKKPLMTKVSMRHLNEIVRERNQYSRDTVEAWQDFINLKGRMDTELSKVTKRNNFLVEELETWKQQVGINLISFSCSELTISSFSNSKRLLNNLPRRPPSSRSRLKDTSVRTAVSLPSSTHRRMTLPVLLYVFPALRSNVMTLWRHWFFSKKSLRSSSANVSATRRSSLPWSTVLRLSLVNVMRLRGLWCTCAV